MKKRLLACILTLVMLLALLSATALAANVISTDTTWDQATTLPQDLVIAQGATLTVKGTITVQGAVTISGGTIQRGEGYTGALITVPENDSLTLTNVVIDGGKESGISAQDAAIRVDGGTLTLNSGAVVQNNNNTNTRENHYYHSGGWRYYNCGGGIAIYNGGTVIMNTGAEIKNNSIINSNYTKQSSGVSFPEEPALVKEGNSHSFGGGVGIYESGTFTMNGGIISGNSALKPDGEGAAYGGGVGLLSRGVDTDHASCNKTEGLRAEFVMNGGQVMNNTATSGGGGFRAADDQGDNKIDRKNHSVISINGGEISNNTTGGAGGGLLIAYASLTVSGNARIANNTATQSGGGIEVSNHSMLTMTGGDVSGNLSSKFGGGIHDSGADATYDGATAKTALSISNVTFKNNSATSGGAIYCNKSDASIEQCVFSGNQATLGNGGAIQNAGENLTITGCTISENTATSNGGGLYSSGKVSLSDTSVTNNTATTDGGGMFIYSSNGFELSGRIIVKENQAGTEDRSNLFIDHTSTDAAIQKNGALTNSEIHFGLSNYYYDDSEQNHVDKTVLSGTEDCPAIASDVVYMYCDATSYAAYFDSADSTIKIGSPAFTITFHANHDGSVETTTQKVVEGKYTMLRPNTFKNPGKTFVEWNTAENGTGDRYKSDIAHTFNQNKDLYAYWRPRALSSLRIESKQAEYVVGTTLTSTDFTVTEVYDNGETELVDPSGYTVAPATLTAAGDVTVTITYNEQTYPCTIKVVPIPVEPITPVIPVTPAAPAQLPFNPDAGKTKFTDVSDNAWYASAVNYAVDKGLMNGTGEGKFSPEADTTRGMIVTILARLDGKNTSGTPWYQAGQRWAMEYEISDGTNMTGAITREQLVTMLYRYAVKNGLEAVTLAENLTQFTDASDISAWAVSAMQWAVGQGLIQGSNGQLRPQANASRAEVATILMRFCEVLGK